MALRGKTEKGTDEGEYKGEENRQTETVIKRDRHTQVKRDRQ